MTEDPSEQVLEAYGVKLNLPLPAEGAGELFIAGHYLQQRLLATALFLDLAHKNGGDPPGNPYNTPHDVRSIMGDEFVVAVYQTRAAIRALRALAPRAASGIDAGLNRLDQSVNADDLKAFRDSLQHEDERVQGLARREPISGHAIAFGGVFISNGLAGRQWHGWRYGTTGVGPDNQTRHVVVDVTPQTLLAVYEAARDAVNAIHAALKTPPNPEAEGAA